VLKVPLKDQFDIEGHRKAEAYFLGSDGRYLFDNYCVIDPTTDTAVRSKIDEHPDAKSTGAAA